MNATFTNQQKRTNKPNISNSEFLNIIFQSVQNNRLRPVLVGFEGNPNTAKGKKWDGYGWNTASSITPKVSENSFYSVAVFNPQPNDTYRRVKKNFSALAVVVLDDIGTEKAILPEKLPLQPTYLLETSKGSFHAGYRLTNPVTDLKEADTLYKALLAQGYSDKGAGGPSARIMRLPEGLNGKAGKNFQCILKEWNPEISYTAEEIIKGFSLDIEGVTSSKKLSSKGLPTNNEIITPIPSNNLVIAELKNRNLYKSNSGNGRHDITCPWCAEHTEEIDSGTAYFEPNEKYPIGGFNCFHSHGAELAIRQLLEYLGVSTTAARMKATIHIAAGQLYQIITCAEHLLSETGEYFQNGGSIVVVKQKAAGEYFMLHVPQQALYSILPSVATWEKYDGRKKGVVIIDPPDKVIVALANAVEYQYLQNILTLAHQPYIRKDGEIVTVNGYDKKSQIFGAFNEELFGIPEKPTRNNAIKALSKLTSILEDFPFASDNDKSAALSAFLTAVVRPGLPKAPMYHVLAPLAGSGKTFLCELITAFASGKRSAPTSFPQSDEECQKVLLAELMCCPAVIEFDNLISDLKAYKSLCSVLTSETFMGRILGVSKTTEVSTRTLFLSSGNNVMPIGDMTHRCITITLNPRCESPITRKFKRPRLLEEVYKNRAEFVSAALTIIKAWIEAGRPQGDIKPLATYDNWSELSRKPLMWLGLPDPAQSLFDSVEQDPDKELLGRLLNAWHSNFDSKPIMVRKVVATIEEYLGEPAEEIEELREVINDIAGGRNGIDKQRFGWWIKRRANRIVNNLQFVKDDGTRAASAWCVKSI